MALSYNVGKQALGMHFLHRCAAKELVVKSRLPFYC